MARPLHFDNTLLIIRALNSLPGTGFRAPVGYTAAEIHARINAILGTITLQQVLAALAYSTSKGVFYENCSKAGVRHYYVNSLMVTLHYANKAYAEAQAGYTTTCGTYGSTTRGADANNGGSGPVSAGSLSVTGGTCGLGSSGSSSSGSSSSGSSSSKTC